MKFFLNHLTSRRASAIGELKSKPLSCCRALGVAPKKATIWIPFPEPVQTLADFDLDFLFRYEIFPDRLLRYFGEWQLEGRTMRPGDVIAQEASVPPGWNGVKLLFGVRVLAVQRTDSEAAFTYGTIEGHPETGTNTFAICIQRSCLFATAQTLARPGTAMSRLLGPIFTKPYVEFCNRQAVLRMKQEFLARNLPDDAPKDWHNRNWPDDSDSGFSAGAI